MNETSFQYDNIKQHKNLTFNINVNATHKPTWTSTENGKIAIAVWKYASPCIFALGTIGNLLSIAVLLRKRMRKFSTSLFLVLLALSDLVHLHSGLLRSVISYSTNATYVSHVEVTQAGCKVHYFFTYFSVHYSAWVLVAVSVERTIAVWMPFRVKQLCSRKSSAITLFIVGILLTAANLHFFWTAGIIPAPRKRNSTICNLSGNQYKVFWRQYWPWIDATLRSYLPFTLIVLSNSLIIAKILQTRRQRKLLTSRTCNHSNGITSMTAMLIGISIGYIITTSPISVFFAYVNYIMYHHGKIPDQFVGSFQLAYAVCMMLHYCNNAVNFLLYCVTGPRFRKELIVMFCCLRTSTLQYKGYYLKKTSYASNVDATKTTRYSLSSSRSNGGSRTSRGSAKNNNSRQSQSRNQTYLSPPSPRNSPMTIR
ncbi:unnamed protein product [Owenia fusiformis]|uniref:Uncharacterized protein n=1 Tax=Owenia fusiformis TaxID=6347 RepID=A0A8J1T4S8_OWEFU|nr:unnamed protein product [Owenia fusiformis]